MEIFCKKNEGIERGHKIAAIVPAFNEEKNVGNVLKVLLSSNFLDEVILVDDGSNDKTAQIGREAGARVVKNGRNLGKAQAMLVGVGSTNADIVIFFDADLLGFQEEHIKMLLSPLLNGEAQMCVGIRDRAKNISWITSRIGLMGAIGGERAINRKLFDELPKKFFLGYAAETVINYYFASKGFLVKYVVLKNLGIIIKESKWGFINGFLSRLKMVWQMAKIRLIIIFNKNELI